ISHDGAEWTVLGKKQTVTIDERTLALAIDAQAANWKMFPSGTNDMVVQFGGKEFPLRLTDAKKISVEPFDAGFKTGVKITLSDWQKPKSFLVRKMDLTLYLTICLQGADEDLVFEIAAKEGNALLRKLNWPQALDPEGVDNTV